MTLHEAVNILSGSLYGSTLHDDKFKEALRLGIEALKQVIFLRGVGTNLSLQKKLPGETLESVIGTDLEGNPLIKRPRGDKK